MNNNIGERISNFSAPITLRSKKRSKVSSLPLGILSFVVLIFFLYLFVHKMIRIDELYYRQIRSSDRLKRNQDTTKAGPIMFAMSFEYFNININELENYFEMNAYLPQRNNGIIQWNRIAMVPCTQNHWSLVGSKSSKHFHYNRYYCLPETVRPITVGYQKIFSKFELTKCKDRPNCKNSSEITNFYRNVLDNFGSFPIYIAILNSFRQIGKPNPFQFGIDTFVYYVTNDISQNLLITFDYLKVKTDYSLSQLWHNFEEVKGLKYSQTRQAFSQLFTLNTNNSLIRIQLSLTNDEIVYQRNLTKFDEALSYIGGLFCIIFLILLFFLRSYNQYKYELRVAENSFNYDADGQKVGQKDLGFFNYLLYKLYYIIFLVFGKRPEWGNCPKMQETIYESKKLLDVEAMNRRLDIMEKAVWQLFEPNYMLMQTLQNSDKIQQIRKKRRMLQYYQQIIHKQNAKTVQEAMIELQDQIEIDDHSSNIQSQKQINNDLEKQVQNMDINEGNAEQLGNQTREQIEKSLKLHLDMNSMHEECKAIANHYQVYVQAKQQRIGYQYNQIQQQLTTSFINLLQQQKRSMIRSIPLKIMHRLRLRSIMMLQQSQQQQKSSREGNNNKQSKQKKSVKFEVQDSYQQTQKYMNVGHDIHM